MSEQDGPPESKGTRDLVNWFSGRRSDVERWVDETCQSAIAKTRGLLADEIHGLSRRVEKMHELLDQLEHYVESSSEDEDENQQENT